ncbi:aspartate kinase [Collinsella intestinalis]|uniref:aspartate kinase n=1 Tax=Collinsella intestinalis TaxID=147207 RepID=UPI00195CBB62|nr:aspartate kinase [Collinsella intestinalis]MBM6683925.1 aspartate kinase [Collinsella intestinalis]
MIKIAKFGGSSVADADHFRKIRSIVEADPARRFIVVSACGRRFSGDAKVTDLLYLVAAHVRYRVSCDDLLADIGQRYFDIADELGLSYPIREEFAAFAEKAKAGLFSTAELVSRGEYFTAQLMAEWLGLPFLDAADVVAFHHDGTLSMRRTHELIQERGIPGGFVMPGFYGATREGQVKLLDRGGGDISGSILAKCLDADLYENWTDVSGFLSADPHIVENPQPISRITYAELRELSYMGASVLHEEAVFPVMEAGIPIAVRNTNRPEDAGTIISDREDYVEDEPIITGITGKRNFVAVHVQKDHMSNEVGIVRRVLSVFERYRVSVEHIPSGIDSFAVVVQGADVKDAIWSIVADIKSEVNVDSIKVVDDLALISTVGRNMIGRPGISGQLFAALGSEGISIRMIAQGSDEINIIVGVRDVDFERAIRAIYRAFSDGDHLLELKDLKKAEEDARPRVEE